MKKLICLLLCCLITACATIDISENTAIRPDEKPPLASNLNDRYVSVAVEVAHTDGATSRGIYFSSPKSIATVLYFGGNEFRIDRESKSVIEGLAKVPVDIVIFDYRGYGRSDGTPTAKLLQSDSLDLFRFVKSRAKNKIVVYGLSLGSYIAANLANSENIDGLVLEGVSTNVKDWATHLVPWYAKPFITINIQPTLLAIDNVKALKDYTGPLLVLAGENDELVPVSLQKSLWEQATTSKKDFHIFSKYGHKGLIQSEEFPKVLKRFLTEEVGI
jgi:pimeloyl-ACP methyl ester carboxylesterase